MKFETIIKTIRKQLEEFEINFIQQGDEFTFAIAKTCTIETEFCSIEIHGKVIKVNDQIVNSIEEVVPKVIAITDNLILNQVKFLFG